MGDPDVNRCQARQTLSGFWTRSAAGERMNPELTPSKTLDPAVVCSDKSQTRSRLTRRPPACIEVGAAPQAACPCLTSLPVLPAQRGLRTLPTIPGHCCTSHCGWPVTALHLPHARSASWSQTPGHGAAAACEGQVTAGAMWSHSAARRFGLSQDLHPALGRRLDGSLCSQIRSHHSCLCHNA